MFKKIIYMLLIIMFMFTSLSVFAEERYKVEFSSCVDGDTAKFLLDNEIITVRLLAVDTPETVHPQKGVEAFGKEASEYTCNKIKEAKEIILEYDDGSDKTDKYDRHLAWIFVDNSLLQEELIERGYAKIAYLYGKYKYTEKLQAIESKAMKEGVGIWSDYEPIPITNTHTVTFSYNGKSKKIEVNQNELVTPIDNPTKKGYEFTGWYLKNEKYDFSLPVTKNIKLVAKFEEEQEDFNLLYYIVGGAVVVVAVITNYKGSRKKLIKKAKKEIKKKLK